MPTRRRLAALFVAAWLWAPAAATAQTTTIPEGNANVSPQPPVRLDESSGKLPNTGTDPRLMFLAGLAMTLLGAGLRLRTADADLY